MRLLSNLKKKISATVLFPVLLSIIAVVISSKSYTPQTSLSGWDTLHPEFNFKHAFESLLWGVWRSDQGLGAIAAHSHMAELPRITYLWITSFFLKLQFLRYSYIFLCLALGPLGMYFFLRNITKSTKHILTSVFASFIGASYYLLNLSTLQQFVVPFEMFATLFAFVPWLFLYAIRYLDEGKKRNILLFGLFALLNAPSAYAATLWYSFAALFGISTFIYTVLQRNRSALRRFVMLCGTLISINLFWILPNMYSALNQSAVIANSQINQNFTPEAFLHNKLFGGFKDVISHKNHLFDWQAYDFGGGQFVQLLANWNTHLENPIVQAIPLVFALMAFCGVVVSIMKRDKFGIANIVPLVLCIFFLMNENGPLGGFYSFLRTHISLLEEGLRMPFTKFSIMFVLFMSYYVSIFLNFLFSQIHRGKLKLVSGVVVLSLFSSLLFLMKPAFKEGIISPLMRVEIPHEYSEAFNWFKGKEGRIAQLPLNSLWGWQYNKWGYQGAGFFWFGVENPVLVRDFDRWSAQNETFYKEASRAFFSDDVATFERTAEKYQVKYLVLDESIFDPGSTQNKSVQDFLSKTTNIKKVATFNFLTIYETPFGETPLSSPAIYAQINADTTYGAVDTVFAQYGNYMTSVKNAWKPFVNFSENALSIVKNGSWVSFTKEINQEGEGFLTIPNIIKRESVVPTQVSVKVNKNTVTVRFDLLTPKIALDGKEISESPVYMTYPLKTSQAPGYLSVESFVFDLSSIKADDEFQFVGNLYVNTQGNTKLQLFGKTIIQNTQFLTEIKNRKASWCSDPSKEESVINLESGIALESLENSVCVGNVVFLSRGGLYQTSYVTPNGETSFFCINQAGTDGCVNIIPPSAELLESSRKITYRTPLESGEYWFAFVGQGGLPSASTATYDQLKLGYYPEIARGRIEFGASFGLFASEKNIEMKDVKEIAVSFFAEPIISENFALKRGHPEAINCELSRKGAVTKDFVANRVIYGATNGGVSCDYFDYPMLLQTQSYLMNIAGENTQGRSVKFYLENRETNHMDREVLLPSGTFSENFVIEPYKAGSGGYVINVETRSFGRIGAQNALDTISFAPVPDHFLSEISIGARDEIVKSNQLNITEVKRNGLMWTARTNGDGVIVLNQASEKGWLALQSGKGFLKREVYNGWANAWKVTGGGKIYVFYLPQALEFMGMIVGTIYIYRLTKRG